MRNTRNDIRMRTFRGAAMAKIARRATAFEWSALLLASVLFTGPPAFAHDDEDCPTLQINSTRDLAFGRVTADGTGAIEVNSNGIPSVTGGVRRVTGGAIAAARFVVEGDLNAADEPVIITLPQEFYLDVSGRQFRVDAISAALDDSGRDWVEIGAGRYQCTLSSTRRCAFVVGGRLNLTDSGAGGAGQGSFRATAFPMRNWRECDGGRDGHS
jgi:hypothetical protein